MTTAPDIYARTTRELLAELDRSQNAFVSLAISGERLRRTCVMTEASAEALATLASYDAALPLYAGPLLEEIQEEVDGLLNEFDAYAATRLEGRDAEAGEDTLDGLDQAFLIGAAGMRAGFYEEADILALSVQVADRLRPHAFGCTELAQAAEDCQLIYGPDPRWPGLSAWWEMFAEAAPSRMALQATVVAEARRKRLIEQAVSRYAASNR